MGRPLGTRSLVAARKVRIVALAAIAGGGLLLGSGTAAARDGSDDIDVVRTPSGEDGPCLPARAALSHETIHDESTYTLRIHVAAPLCTPVDAVAARMMGFDAMKLEFIRLADELGLGVGRSDGIEIVGDTSAAAERWDFRTGDNAASRIGKLFWFGPMRWLQRLMFHTPLVYAFILGSALYHDRIWYPLKGKPVVRQWLSDSQWGRLFAGYTAGASARAIASTMP